MGNGEIPRTDSGNNGNLQRASASLADVLGLICGNLEADGADGNDKINELTKYIMTASMPDDVRNHILEQLEKILDRKGGGYGELIITKKEISALEEKNAKLNEINSLISYITTAQISNDEDLKKLKNYILEQLKEIFDSDACTIFTVSPDNNEIMLADAVSGGDAKVINFGVPKYNKDGKICTVARYGFENGAIIVPDMRSFEFYNKDSLFAIGYLVTASMCVPLIVGGIAIGVVQIMNKSISPEASQKAKEVNKRFKHGIKMLEKDFSGDDLKEALEKLAEIYLIKAREIFKDSYTDFDLEQFERINDALSQKLNDYFTLEAKKNNFLTGFWQAMKTALRITDPYTITHSERVMEIACKFAETYKEKLNLTDDDGKLLKWIGLLHDIGKLDIPRPILHKFCRLTKEEFDVMKTHPKKSAEWILGLIMDESNKPANVAIGAIQQKESEDFRKMAEIVEAHHERPDGKGYPNGLKREDIPLLARILAMADAFDAMMSKRPYKNPLQFDAVIEEMRKNAGKQFDSNLIEDFIAMVSNEKIMVNYVEINDTGNKSPDTGEQTPEKVSITDLYKGDTCPDVFSQRTAEILELMTPLISKKTGLTEEQIREQLDTGNISDQLKNAIAEISLEARRKNRNQDGNTKNI